MCLGVPAQIIKTRKTLFELATVEVCGVRREVNISLVCEDDPSTLQGKWVLVHVGFAMSIINEQEAQNTLKALQSVNQLDHELNDFEGLNVRT